MWGIIAVSKENTRTTETELIINDIITEKLLEMW